MNKRIINDKTYATLALINFIFAVFVDSIFIFKDFSISGIESIVYLITFNVAFLVFLILAVMKSKGKVKRIPLKNVFAEYCPVIIVSIFAVVLAAVSYDTTAVYDAHLYYGSFLNGIELFDMTAKNAIGAFNQWGHNFTGTALFLVPFECLAFGKMICTYIASTLLLVITLFVLYRLLRDSFGSANKWFVAFVVAGFAFMPYSLNLVTYFCPDFYLELYLVWLLYAYKKDNQIMVSFIGFLLCLTKDPGAYIYGFFLLFAFLYQIYFNYGVKNFTWLKPKNIPFLRFVLWIIPAVLYAANYFLKNVIQLQEFPAGGQLTFGITAYDIGIQSLISFVYGFRWLIIVIFVCAIIAAAVNKNTGERSGIKLEKDDKVEFYALALTLLTLNAIFSIFTLSHCPRYTSPFNVLYAIMLMYSLSVLFEKSQAKKTISAFLICVVFGVQTFITIDPAIKNTCSYISTGESKIYNIGNTRNSEPGFFSDLIGDYFVYNNEYRAAEEISDQALRVLDPKDDVTVLIYETYFYEYHIGGLQYRIYWDKQDKKQIYRPNKNTVFVNSVTVNDYEITNQLGEYVYLLVPERKDANKALNKFAQAGYEISSQTKLSNFNGQADLFVFHLAQ